MEAEYASSSLEQNVSMSPQEFTPTDTMEMQPKQKTKYYVMNIKYSINI